jgi:hypothetical protein
MERRQILPSTRWTMTEHNPDSMHRFDASLSSWDGVPYHLQPGEVVEVPLLLSVGQMSALEEAAHRRGLTAGQMVRQLLQDFIAIPAKPFPVPCKVAVF